ncbi:MAG: hypothetical protein H5U04_11235 [Firmicutes bacterium]|nr:hypothetical protein [Bacillota bacterium]
MQGVPIRDPLPVSGGEVWLLDHGGGLRISKDSAGVIDDHAQVPQEVEPEQALDSRELWDVVAHHLKVGQAQAAKLDGLHTDERGLDESVPAMWMGGAAAARPRVSYSAVCGGGGGVT